MCSVPSFGEMPSEMTLWASQPDLPFTKVEPVFTFSHAPTLTPLTVRRASQTDCVEPFVSYHAVY